MKVKVYCKLSKAKPGMLLAEDVCDQQGICLMTSGLVLTESRLASIQSRHIDGVTIWQEQLLGKSEIIEQREAVTAGLASRFRLLQDNPEMTRLHDILLTYRMQCFEEQLTSIDADGNTE